MTFIHETDLKEKITVLRSEKKKIVFTNGCFDILHTGHISYLEKAKKLGDILIVGVNSDESVKKIKGDNRPINNEHDRASLVDALKCVDYVCIFRETTPELVLSIIKPDIHAKGGDYSALDLPEAGCIQEFGGKIVILPEIKGKSTTNLINKIVYLYRGK